MQQLRGMLILTVGNYVAKIGSTMTGALIYRIIR
jgi:hypothetical protein